MKSGDEVSAVQGIELGSLVTLTLLCVNFFSARTYHAVPLNFFFARTYSAVPLSCFLLILPYCGPIFFFRAHLLCEEK